MALQGSGERDEKRSLEERLRSARARQGLDAPPEPTVPMGAPVSSSAMGTAARVGVDLVSALAVGLGIGWLLDHWLHTMPVFLAIFVLLGGAAGILNVWRQMGPRARRPR